MSPHSHTPFAGIEGACEYLTLLEALEDPAGALRQDTEEAGAQPAAARRLEALHWWSTR